MMTKIYVLICIALCFDSSKSDNNDLTLPNEIDHLELLQLVSNITQFFPNVPAIDTFFGAHSNISGVFWENPSLCMEQLQILNEGVKKKEKWALQMLDASSKLPPGILQGNLFLIGNYDECIEVKHFYSREEPSFSSRVIKGQYCSAVVSFKRKPKNPFETTSQGNYRQMEILISEMIFSLGLCIPASCSALDLQNITNVLTNLYTPDLYLLFVDELCASEDTKVDIPLRSVISLTIFGLFGVLLGLATIADICNLKGNNNVLRCFSMYTNGKKLLTSKVSEDSLKCLDGLRVISLMLVLLGHRFIGATGVPAVNKIFVQQSADYWYSYIFVGLGFAVDTFFTISGLLVVYLYMTKIEKGGKISWPMFYFHRIIRLTPSLIMVVLFYATLMQFVGHNPFNVLDETLGATCREYWWTTILYIQNYWNPNDMCAVQAWYIAIDTQIYLVAPILLLCCKKGPSKAVLLMLSLILLSMAAAFHITWQKNLGATYLNQDDEEYKYLYTPTHIRISPWLIGALTGYFIFKNKGKAFPLKKLLVLFLWVFALGMIVFVLLIQKVYHDKEYDVFLAALFNAFARPLWGLAVCIIVLLCVFNHGGLINSFLSCSVFTTLIRVNYALYLIHMVILYSIIGNLKTPVYLSYFNVIHDSIGDYFLALIVSFFWTLAFESPIIALEKLYFSQGDFGKDKYTINGEMKISKGSCETVIMK